MKAKELIVFEEIIAPVALLMEEEADKLGAAYIQLSK